MMSQIIFRPTLAYNRAKSNLVGQIYCTFPMRKPMIFYNNVPTLNDQLPTLILSTGNTHIRIYYSARNSGRTFSNQH